MTGPLIYVAGPITGDPFGCVRNAVKVWEELRALGAVPFLPQLSVLHEMVSPQPYEEWLLYDFDVLRHCHALVRLPGLSPGADGEVAFVRNELLRPVFDWDQESERERFADWMHRNYRRAEA